ncbi:MAG: HD domain-containing protein [Firmicutes bacterium]|nr:HD domain-containing protein [Bacillota bacterium]
MLDRLIAEPCSHKPLDASRQKALLLAAAALVEMRDPVTAGHSARVGNLSAIIARELGLIPDIQSALRLAGLVHDIGKNPERYARGDPVPGGLVTICVCTDRAGGAARRAEPTAGRATKPAPQVF